MKYLLLILTLLPSVHSFGQKIHFVDLSNKWYVDETEYRQFPTPVTERCSYSFTDSIVIDGLMFYQLEKSATPVFYQQRPDRVYIREDTSTGRVFVNDTSHILYNFNLQLGDTFRAPGNSFRLHIVTAVNSIYIDGNSYKTISLRDPSTFCSYCGYTVIEGIGCITSPLLPYYGDVMGSATYWWYHTIQLKCFENKVRNPLIGSGLNLPASHCDTPFLLIKDLPPNADVNIYPQPAHEFVTISLPVNAASGTIEIYNATGQRVYEQQFSNKQKLEISGDNWRGLYIYHIKTNDSDHAGKLIFQ